MERKITRKLLEDFEKRMLEDEKSKATTQKYLRDLHCFVNYANDRAIDKGHVLEYKAELARAYALTSENSMLDASLPIISLKRPMQKGCLIVMENGLHSVSFPFITAGVFGGSLADPAGESTKQYCRVYLKFTADYPDYAPLVMFSILLHCIGDKSRGVCSKQLC